MIYEAHFGKFIPNITQRELMAIFNGKSNISKCSAHKHILLFNIKSKTYSSEIKWALPLQMGVFSKKQRIVLDHLGINSSIV